MPQFIKQIAEKRSVEAFYTGGSVKWSANGRKLFSTCSNIVKVIDLDNNNESYSIGDPEDELRITCINIDKNRNRLLIAFNNNVIREYTIPLEKDEKPELARTWKTMHTAPILVMEFSSNGNLFATGSADHIVKVWNLQEQQCIHTLNGPTVVSAIVFGMHDKLVVGYIEGQIRLFNIMRGAPKKLINEWNSHNSHITALLQVPDTRIVVALSRDQTMSLHETETQETLKVLPIFESVEDAAIGHNGHIFTVGEEGYLKEFVIDTAKLVRKQRITGGRLDQLTYDPISNRFLAVSAEENLYIIEHEHLKVCHQIVGFHDEIYSCCIIGQNESHLAVASNTSELRVYNLQTLDCKLVPGHTDCVLGVDSPSWDSSLLASCSKDNSIIYWRFHENNNGTILTPIAVSTGHANSVNSIVFSNTANSPFILSVSTDCTLKVWSLANISKVGDSKVDPESENLAELLPKIACSSTMVAHSKDVNCVDVSNSDAVIATGGMDKLIKLWQIDKNRMQLGIAGTLTGHRRGVSDVKFAKGSHRLASSSGDMTIKIWDVAEKTCLQTLAGHTCAVFRLLLVRNDMQIISADSAGIMKIWTISNRECETTIEGHKDKIWAMITNKNESEIMTAGSDGRIVVWKDVTEEKEMEEDAKRREKLEQEQVLTNLMDQKRFQEALEYSLTLARPYCAWKVVNELITENELADALTRLDDRNMQILISFAVKWNTNSATSSAAQRVFFEFIQIVHPDKILAYPNAFQLVESFMPYTNRHMDRLDRAKQDVSLINFVWKNMKSEM